MARTPVIHDTECWGGFYLWKTHRKRSKTLTGTSPLSREHCPCVCHVPKKGTQKVVIVGATKFPLEPKLMEGVVDIMRSYPKGTIFLTRAGVSPFDQFVTRAAGILGYPVARFIGRGGTDNLERDDELVKEGDAFLCFLSPELQRVGLTEDEMKKKSGTIMVLEKALTARKPVRAYTAVDDRLVWAGESGA